MMEKKKKKNHPFRHTNIEHHSDGSHTIEHVHESGDPKKNVKSAVPEHDALIDHMLDHTGPQVEEPTPEATPVPPPEVGPPSGMMPMGQ